MTGLAPITTGSLPSGQPSVSLSLDKKTILLNFGGRAFYKVTSAEGDLPEDVMESLKLLFEEKLTDTQFKKNIENTAQNKEICKVDLKEKKCIFYKNGEKNKHKIKNEYHWSDSAEKTRTAATSALNLPTQPASKPPTQPPTGPISKPLTQPVPVSNPLTQPVLVSSPPTQPPTGPISKPLTQPVPVSNLLTQPALVSSPPTQSVPVSSSKPPIQPMRSPIGIPNPNIACYRIASIQGLLACPSFRPLLNQQIETGQDITERNTIRVALLELLQMLESSNPPLQELSNAEIYLNKLIESYSIKKEHFLTSAERNSPGNLQLDANDFVDFLLTEVLMQSNTYEKTISGTAFHPTTGEPFPVMDYPVGFTPSPSSVLSVNRTRMSNPTLSDMIDKHFKEDIINQKLNLDVYKINKYNQTIKILGPPKNMLTLRVERSSWNVALQANEIDTTPIKIPEDNHVDLSTAYGNEKGTNLYEISSFILRTSMKGYANRSGHFISYVKKDNQWFECNDSKVTKKSEREIKKIMPQAYMFFLEKGE